MKRYYAFLTAVFLVLILCVGCSCDVGKDSSVPSSEQTSSNIDPSISHQALFDYEMKHQPSDSDMLKITKGMPFDEVINIIGLPHGIADNISISSYFKWVFLEGNEYIIFFIPKDTVDNADQLEPLEYYSYTETAFAPRLIKNENSKKTTQRKTDMLSENFFDEDIKSLPSNKDISNIKIGMTFNEVIQRIGRPHGKADRVSFDGYFKWNTVEGNVYVIFFGSDLDFETTRTMMPDEYYQNAVVFCSPRCIVDSKT